MAYDKREISGNIGFFDRNTVVDLERSVYAAAREGELMSVKGIVATMKSLDVPINVRQIIILNLKYQANLNVIEYMLSEGDNLQEYDIFLIYITAAQNGHKDIMEYFDDYMILKQDFHNYGLINAAEFGKLNVIEYLLSFPDVDLKFVERAVIKACDKGHAKVIASLINCDENMLLDAVRQQDLNFINAIAENMLNHRSFLGPLM